jgi:hypothetical protein
MGGVLGGVLGAASAFIVDMIAATFYATPPVWSQRWDTCAFMGVIPAVPAGFLLGTFIIIRNDRRRLVNGSLLGLGVGILYARLWLGSATGADLVMSAIIGSGLIGGLTLALLLTAIRRRWQWWTRWEEEPRCA